MRTLALCGASCKRRSFFYCTGAAWKSLRLLPLLMVEGYLGRSWVVWTGAMGFADELRIDGVLGSTAYEWLGQGALRPASAQTCMPSNAKCASDTNTLTR